MQGRIKIKTRLLIESERTKRIGLWFNERRPDLSFKIMQKYPKNSYIRRIMKQLSLKDKKNNIQFLNVFEDREYTIFEYITKI